MSEEKNCSDCINWSRHVCTDDVGNPVAREARLAPEPVWYYETCKKNWGLPQNAYINGSKCKFWRK